MQTEPVGTGVSKSSDDSLGVADDLVLEVGDGFGVMDPGALADTLAAGLDNTTGALTDGLLIGLDSWLAVGVLDSLGAGVDDGFCVRFDAELGNGVGLGSFIAPLTSFMLENCFSDSLDTQMVSLMASVFTHTSPLMQSVLFLQISS